MTITPATMQVLLTHTWPGNVRELRNTMEFVMAAAPDDTVEPYDLPERLGGSRPTAKASIGACRTYAFQLSLGRSSMTSRLEMDGFVPIPTWRSAHVRQPTRHRCPKAAWEPVPEPRSARCSADGDCPA